MMSEAQENKFEEIMYEMSECQNSHNTYSSMMASSIGKVNRGREIIEGIGSLKVRGNHDWQNHQWVSTYRVWFEQCSRCGAVRIWRGNDIIYKSPTTACLYSFVLKPMKRIFKDGVIIGFEGTDFSHAGTLVRNVMEEVGIKWEWQKKTEKTEQS